MDDNNLIEAYSRLWDRETVTIEDMVHKIWESILAEGTEERRAGRYQEILCKLSPADLFPQDGEGNHERYVKQIFKLLDQNENITSIENQTIRGLIRQNPRDDEFYRMLFQRNQDPVLLEKENQREIFFLFVWLDIRLPYYQIDDVPRIEDSRFSDILDEIEPIIKKARFIINRGGLQRTQETALLIKLSEEIGDAEKQSVFWAIAMAEVSALSEKRALARRKRREKRRAEDEAPGEDAR